LLAFLQKLGVFEHLGIDELRYLQDQIRSSKTYYHVQRLEQFCPKPNAKVQMMVQNLIQVIDVAKPAAK
jgi:hypothetical protein